MVLLACFGSSLLEAEPLTLEVALEEGRASLTYLQVLQKDVVASVVEAVGIAAASPQWTVATSPLISSGLSTSMDSRWKDLSSSLSASLSWILPGEVSLQTSFSAETSLAGVGTESTFLGFSPSAQFRLSVPMTWDTPSPKGTLAVQSAVEARLRATLDLAHEVAVWERQMAGWYFQARSALRTLELQDQTLAYFEERASAARQMHSNGTVSEASLWEVETELNNAQEARFLSQMTWRNASKQLADELGRDPSGLELAEDLTVPEGLPPPGVYGREVLSWERLGLELATSRRLYSEAPVLTSSLLVAPHAPPGVPAVLPIQSAWENWAGPGAGLAANWSVGISWTGTTGGLARWAQNRDKEELALLDQRMELQRQSELRRRASAQQQWAIRLQISSFYAEALQRSAAFVRSLEEQHDLGLIDTMTVWQARLKAKAYFNKWMDAQEAMILMGYDEKTQ